MKSKITGGQTQLLFTKKVLHKYEVKYYQCVETGFIQTEEPYWLSEAYNNVITSLDVGLVQRNLNFAQQVSSIILANFNDKETFLDYGAGFGLFVRLMRDRGFQFFWNDLYAQNILALGFSASDLKRQHQFELITAFEVFEHLVDPIQTMKDMLLRSKHILFSTELVPPQNDIESWWYILPETGQHVSFYSLKSLQYLADYFGLNLYSNNKDFHLLTEKSFKHNPLLIKPANMTQRLYEAWQIINGRKPGPSKPSLIGPDYTYILSAFNAGKKFND